MGLPQITLLIQPLIYFYVVRTEAVEQKWWPTQARLRPLAKEKVGHVARVRLMRGMPENLLCVVGRLFLA